VISTLTGGIETLLINRPSYDVTSLMGGTHAALDSIVGNISRSPAFISAFMPSRLQANIRNTIAQIFRANNSESILYGFLLT